MDNYHELKKSSSSKTNSKELCGICSVNGHVTQECFTILAFQDVLQEQSNMINAYKRPFSSPFSKSYNPN